jgi:hypothetical protein
MYTPITTGYSGISLQLILDHCTIQDAIKLFGYPSRDAAYFDPDSGYDGWDWVFQGPNGPVSLYARWGNLRIGARSLKEAEDFKAWLTQQGLFV